VNAWGPTRLKVCCVASVVEARLATQAGADAIGLVGPMPSGPGTIPLQRAAHIARAVPPGVSTVLLTSEVDPQAIVSQHRLARTSALQFVDALPEGSHAALREALPGIGLVQVVHVTGAESLLEARALAPHVDALLLDSGRPDAPIKELGGTGRVHDWNLSARIVEAVDVPVFLAGGLRPENVAQAVSAVGPYGVDVCSGLRVDGALNAARLAAFCAALRGA
jgi:phosphoribosylanthranilate isomerase